MIEDDIKIEVLSVRHYKAGYEVRKEKQTFDTDPDHPVLVSSAYTVPKGQYIGDPKWAHRLIVQRGIKPELNKQSHCVCSIGFCEKEQKWYGWSHRAIFGFGIGDLVKEGDCTASFGIGFEAKNLEDAKRMAVAFAESVS